MSNTIQRLILFAVALPLIVLVSLLPMFNHLPVTLVIILATAIGAGEMAGMIAAKGMRARMVPSRIIGGLIPSLFWLSTMVVPGSGPLLSSPLILACLVLAFLCPFAFSRLEHAPGLLAEVMSTAFVAIYPGLLGAYLVLIAAQSGSNSAGFITFILMTIGTDAVAWFFGMSVGGRRGIVPVSPNKSLAGFAGGILASVGIAFLASSVYPEALPLNPWILAPMGILVGAACEVGDLFESALKRSAELKDSGRLIPGRGGILDSIDSLLFAAPVFHAFQTTFHLFS